MIAGRLGDLKAVWSFHYWSWKRLRNTGRGVAGVSTARKNMRRIAKMILKESKCLNSQ